MLPRGADVDGRSHVADEIWPSGIGCHGRRLGGCAVMAAPPRRAWPAAGTAGAPKTRAPWPCWHLATGQSPAEAAWASAGGLPDALRLCCLLQPAPRSYALQHAAEFLVLQPAAKAHVRHPASGNLWLPPSAHGAARPPALATDAPCAHTPGHDAQAGFPARG
eukprot:365535-Chlamydomonas_euryale.AAC.88